jgi:hypothetical protein
MRRVAFLIALCTFGLAACAADAESDAGDVGDTTSNLTSGGNGGCDRNKLLAAVTGARKTVLQRGLHWVDQNVQYSQSSSHEGYRTDCSGFVSMCWQLGTSFTTADFISGDGQNTILPSYDSLIPGDGFVRRSGGAGHAILFAGWQDSAHTSACVMEEESTALDMQFHVRTSSSLRSSGFKAMRAKKLGSASAGGAPSIEAPDTSSPTTPPTHAPSAPTPTPSDNTGTGPAPDDNGGSECISDGACNPGNDGSGLICSGGKCVPGCHIDANCPGVTTCVQGQCK